MRLTVSVQGCEQLVKVDPADCAASASVALPPQHVSIPCAFRTRLRAGSVCTTSSTVVALVNWCAAISRLIVQSQYKAVYASILSVRKNIAEAAKQVKANVAMIRGLHQADRWRDRPRNYRSASQIHG